MKKHISITIIKSNKPKFKTIFIKKFMMEMIKSQDIGWMAYSMDKPKYNIKTEIILSNFTIYLRGKFEKGYKVDGLMVFKAQGSYQGAFYN